MLPFARSCIAKLKELGLPFASQSFEADGALIRVSLTPGHEYISIDGVGGIALESGVVDLGSISFQNTDPDLGYAIPENIYNAASLYRSGHVTSYEAGFVQGGPPTGYTKPYSEQGQFAGTITGIPNSIRGRTLKTDGPCLAFSPGQTPNEATGALESNKKDADLASKKWGARWCPPSMFTGKCRMYVQALMGSPLYKAGVETKASQHPYISPDPTQIPPPQLYLPGSSGKGVVIIDTSTGVFLDKSDYSHWLFVVRADQIHVYPLKPSIAGKFARKALRKVVVQDDFDHLETYILSESYPVVAAEQIIPIDPQIPMSGCGYGWHWAWETPVADLVQNIVFEQDESHSAMRSTHFRITFTPNYSEIEGKKTTTWDMLRSTISGPTEWAAHSQLFCIASPLFGSNFLSKLLPKSTNLFNSGSTFYVFYKRDELELCTYAGGVKIAVTDTWGPTSQWNDGWHLGMRDAGRSIDVRGYEIYGKFSDTASTFQRSDNFQKSAVYDKQEAGETIPGNYSLLRAVYPDYGYPLEGDVLTGPSTWAFETILRPSPEFPVEVESGGGYYRAFRFININYSDTFTCQNVAAIPFFDAEAIYFYSHSQQVHTLAYQKNETYRNGALSKTLIADGVVYEAFTWSQYHAFTPTSTEVVPPKTTTTDFTECQLVCSSGTFPATFSDGLLAMFWNPLEGAVSATIATTSGINRGAPAVIAEGYIDAVGAGLGATATLPIVIGWA